MEHVSKTLLKKGLSLFTVLLVATTLIGLSAYVRPAVAHASPTRALEKNGLAQTPFWAGVPGTLLATTLLKPTLKHRPRLKRVN